MEAYEIFKIKDDKPENYIDPYRQLMDQLLTRADSLISAGNNDVASKIKGELMLGRTIFGDSNEAIEEFIKDAANIYKNLSIVDQRNTDATLRDIINSFGEEIASNGDVAGKKQYMDILDEYLEFKTNIDTVSPEAAAEVDRLAAMSDEEFEAEMNKPDEDEEEDSDELDTPILQDDFDNLSVKELVEKYGAHDTALCLIQTIRNFLDTNMEHLLMLPIQRSIILTTIFLTRNFILKSKKKRGSKCSLSLSYYFTTATLLPSVKYT